MSSANEEQPCERVKTLEEILQEYAMIERDYKEPLFDSNGGLLSPQTLPLANRDVAKHLSYILLNTVNYQSTFVQTTRSLTKTLLCWLSENLHSAGFSPTFQIWLEFLTMFRYFAYYYFNVASQPVVEKAYVHLLKISLFRAYRRHMLVSEQSFGIKDSRSPFLQVVLPDPLPLGYSFHLVEMHHVSYKVATAQRVAIVYQMLHSD